MGKFQGILGMDWLGHSHVEINCSQGTILFSSNQGNRVRIQGRSSKNPLKVVKANKIAKGYKKSITYLLYNLISNK